MREVPEAISRSVQGLNIWRAAGQIQRRCRLRLSSYVTAKPQAAIRKSPIQVIQHCRARELDGAVVIVPHAFGRRFILQRAAEVVLAVNDDPAPLELDALERRR